MNNERVSDFLLELYRESRQETIKTFQARALARLRETLKFDKAWWGTARREGTELTLHSWCTYQLPDDYAQSWEAIKQDDPIVAAVFAEPGKTVYFSARQMHSTPGLAALSKRIGLGPTLCTVNFNADLGLFAFMSLYRSPGAGAFSACDRALKQMLMPHLSAALNANQIMQIERLHAYADGSRSRLAVIDRQHYLNTAEPSFDEFMRKEWPQWTGPRLPEPLSRALAESDVYCGRQVRVRKFAVTDFSLIEVAPLNTADQLSPREAQIARLYSEGHSHKRIAVMLDAAPATVRHHLRGVYRKLEISDKATLGRLLAAPRDTRSQVSAL